MAQPAEQNARSHPTRRHDRSRPLSGVTPVSPPVRLLGRKQPSTHMGIQFAIAYFFNTSCRTKPYVSIRASRGVQRCESDVLFSDSNLKDHTPVFLKTKPSISDDQLVQFTQEQFLCSDEVK